MTDHWRDTFLTWAESAEFAGHLKEAQREIRRALEDASRPLVAYSGGKDSTAMMHLVLSEKPSCEVLHWDYGPYYIPRPIHEEIMHIAESMGARVRLETSPLYLRLKRQAINVMGRELIQKLLPRLVEEGFDLEFVGLREEESLKRQRRIRRGEMLCSGLLENWPLRRWRWLDVWAYLVSRDVPYLSLYDSRAALVGYEQARFTTLFDPEFADLGADSVDNVLHWRWRHDCGGTGEELVSKGARLVGPEEEQA